MEDTFKKNADLKINMLGEFQVWHKQKNIIWPTQKSKALLQILLITPGKIVPTDQILEYLWPSLSPHKAQNNLWVTTSQLRRVLQPDTPPRARNSYIYKEIEGYRFINNSSFQLDVASFSLLLAKIQTLTFDEEIIETLKIAKSLYRGEYLEDEPYAEWAQASKIQYRASYEKLLIELAHLYEERGNFQQVITSCQEILTINKTNEPIFRMLMRSYTSLGERATALQIYDDAVQNLQNEIGVDPMPETIQLADHIRNISENLKPENSETQNFSPFIGREKELIQLSSLVTNINHQSGSITLIAGEAGIGKSRLVREVINTIDKKDFSLFSVSCYQLEMGIPYYPIIEFVKQLFTQHKAWQELSPIWLRELIVLSPEIEEIVTTIIPDISKPEHGRQAQLFQAIVKLLTTHANTQKTLLVIEDIHWADIATIQFLHFVARHISKVPISIVLSKREERNSKDPNLFNLIHTLKQESYFSSITLSRLPSIYTSELISKTIKTADMDDGFKEWIFRETNGNPFFIVSILQSLIEDGTLNENSIDIDWQASSVKDPTLALPNSIRNAVRSRFGNLSASEHEVLNMLSVLNQNADLKMLNSIIDLAKLSLLEILEKLAERQILSEMQGKYQFHHNKIREVVYTDISIARRQIIHLQIAESLEKMSLNPENSSILSHHFKYSDNPEKAILYLIKAGNHALNSYAYQQAILHFENALDISTNQAKKVELYLLLSNAFIQNEEYQKATEYSQIGLQITKIINDNHMQTKLLYAIAQSASHQHRTDGGKTEVEQALEMATKNEDKYHQALGLLLLTEVQEGKGNLSKALKTAKLAQKISNQISDAQIEARAQLEIGFLYAQQANFDKSVSATEQGLKLLENSNDRNSKAYAWNILGRALGGRGDYTLAFEAFHYSNEEAKIVGDRYFSAQYFNMLGWLYRELGDYENALMYDQQGVKYSIKWNKPSPEISARINICLDLVHLNKAKKAFKMLAEIEAQIDSGDFGFHNWRWQQRLLYTRGICLLALDRPKKALLIAQQGLPIAEKAKNKKYMALNHELLSIALTKSNRFDEAIIEIKSAISMADSIKYQPIRWGSRKLLANHLKISGQEQESINTFFEAEKIILNIANDLEDETLKSIFLGTNLPPITSKE